MGWTRTPSWQGLVWRWLRHLKSLTFSFLAPWSPPGGTSGGLFQGTDDLLKDVRAVVGYLLENGVGELLQFCIVPFNFLQLTLKLLLGHLLQLILPSCLVIIRTIRSWWSESTKD